MSVKSRIPEFEYVPASFNDMVTYCTIYSGHPERTGAYFKVLSIIHAKIMARLHPNLAPAINKRRNLAEGFGDWHLVGITPTSLRRDVFLATLIVNGK